GALFQQAEAVAGTGRAVFGKRDLLSDNRSQIAVECQQILLDIPPGAIRIDLWKAGIGRRIERGAVEKREHRVNPPPVEEAKAADLWAKVAGVPIIEEDRRWHAEHADLGVHVAQVRDLERLRKELEGRIRARAELALDRIQRVTTVAVAETVGQTR